MKIGMIAMSGVRARDEELTKIGLTLPGFVERSQVIASLPSLGLLTLAGLTPPEIEVEYHEIEDLRKEPVLPFGFDLVAISSYTAQVNDAYVVAGHYREQAIPVVMGGLHVTVLPDEATDRGIVAGTGEGELVWPHIVDDLLRGSLRPRYDPLPGEEFDLAHAPMPRFDLLDPAKYNRLTVQTARGCPHRCDFCASSILLTRKYKLKPVPKILEEIRAIKRIWDRPFIEFADDNSFVNRRHAKELLRALREENVRWFTETDVSIADDPDLLGLMRDSGCRQVLIGLESPTETGLAGIELNADWKRKRLDGYRRAIETIQSYGISVNGCFVLGLDGDTAEVFDAVYDFVRESGLYEVQVTRMTPFPGTPLYEKLRREGRLLEEGAWDGCTLFDMNYLPKRMSLEELETGSLALGLRLYTDDEVRRRRDRFKETLRTSPNARRSR